MDYWPARLVHPCSDRGPTKQLVGLNYQSVGGDGGRMWAALQSGACSQVDPDGNLPSLWPPMERRVATAKLDFIRSYAQRG
jgi:hypothetical protein